MEDEDDEEGLEFWDIEVDHGKFPAARGILYARPSPSTVRARLYFPRLEPRPFLRPGGRTTLSAFCANGRWMRGIRAEIKAVDDHPNGSQKVEILLYRKNGGAVH